VSEGVGSLLSLGDWNLPSRDQMQNTYHSQRTHAVTAGSRRKYPCSAAARRWLREHSLMESIFQVDRGSVDEMMLTPYMA
jgi:hypothetical protein